MKKIRIAGIAFGLTAALFALTGLYSCGDDDSSSASFLVMEMQLVNVFRGDTVYHNFSYQQGVLKEVNISGNTINRTYIAEINGNGKVTEAGNKRFEWQGERLVKIIDDNGIWTDLTYDADKLLSGEYFDFDANNDIRKRGSFMITDNGTNLAQVDRANESDVVLEKHSFAGFDNRVNVFNAIWWFHYVGETLGALRSGTIPDALYMQNNPGSYLYELPQQQFSRTINYTYIYDDQGRVTLIEFEVGTDTFNLIFKY